MAPEVKRGIASQEGDVYSFGRILEKLDFSQNKKEQGKADNAKKIEEYGTMIQGMVAKDRYQRWLLTDIYQCLFSKLKKVKRLRSRS